MGRYLTAGMSVFSIIGTENVWVDANPKETDLTYMRAGPARHHHDRCLSVQAVAGTVAAISPGTGAQFTILPPQNAAGNWIKIVQRVPLRIEFERGQDVQPAALGHERHGRDRHRPARQARVGCSARAGGSGSRPMTAHRARWALQSVSCSDGWSPSS